MSKLFLIVTLIFICKIDCEINEEDVWNRVSQGYDLNFRPPTQNGQPLYVTANYRLVNLIAVVCYLI